MRLLREEELLLFTPEERDEELLLLVVVAEREERDEELLEPLMPPPLVGRELLLMVVPLRVFDNSPLAGAVILPLPLVAGVSSVRVLLRTPPLVVRSNAGRAEEPTVAPPREEVVPLPLVPLAICVPPREVERTPPPPNCSR